MKSEAIVELGKPLQTIETKTPEPKGKEVKVGRFPWGVVISPN